ncbi:flagellar hook-associated protein FlgK [Dactylosporangium aurantiacum]|uniref:Flagellar hook-associated protein 1 n=1 Tax=Dactylosporangium aurantiacum TaxID=35754 RepID=A0A9Q9MIF3_9ACTN|nr:flagellar hook-associated protein FlgK [Dactylosporangium aurantiacum]MDG6102045.1 flagellar hook-associated protein FlgK [Dactylosporangium aurantiacum]UWZ53621.1 flagellar hook-associated protein FlgK [Dactylosporangium aurantiacum]
MSTFSGLNSALSALYAQRRALDITGQNIANVNTEGYSRQRVELSPVENVTEPARYSLSSGVGDGVRITGVTRLHNEFMTNRTRAEHGLNEYLQAQKVVYGNIEQALGEPSDTGLQSQLSDYWNAWSDVANRPGDASARTQLLARANTVAGTMRTTRANLGDLYAATREQLDADIDVVNQTTAGIADLNARIALAKVADMPTNELSDKRDQLVLRLSELTGATARQKEDGTTDVLLAGAVIVQGDTVRQLEAVGSTTVDGRTVAPPQVQFVGGPVAAITTGRIASRLEALNKTVPDAVKGLDTVAGLLITTVNAQHAQGWDITVVPPATTPTPVRGGDFFSGTDARDIGVAINDPSKVAASSTATNPFQGDNAIAMANLAKDPNGADVTYRNFVVDIGVAAQTVNRRADAQQVISDDVSAAEQAESGVSLDEEMTNMLQFQRAYEAAAKVISVIDTTLDSLINMKR